jgi:outer membrane protein OmpA-like peptidoglycan-associated protein
MALSFSPPARGTRGTRGARARAAVSVLTLVSSLVPSLVTGAIGAACMLTAAPAEAQQATFHLDRLEVPGSPDDGMVLFRPQTEPGTVIYGQLGLGYSLNPLHTGDITTSPAALHYTQGDPITNQFTTYFSAGFEFFDRLTVGVTMPVTWVETGNQLEGGPNGGIFVGPGINPYDTNGPAAGDLRLDARYVIWRSADRSLAFGAQLSLFAPTGQSSTSNFGGDGSNVEFMPMVNAEWTPTKKVPIAFVVDTGFHFRTENVIDDPAGKYGTADGLGIGNEWRWAVGAYLPLAGGKFRLGADIFGQTGITNDGTVGNTVFTKQNTPIEYDVEGRMRLPKFAGSDKWYVGAGAGSLIANGYGAPDLRIVGLFGTYWTINDTEAPSPEARQKVHVAIRESMKDTDGDGIPDDIDACPTVPEDHKDPDPGDGCPAPADRDGDGIPDDVDKCPDQPEDKDGIEDSDGCPEDDVDKDGIPDAQDACPKEPGQPDPDPKKNGCPKFIRLEGSTVRVLQQVHFATGSATILPDSFPMLLEIVKLLQATPGIKQMKVEGHTDNRGAAAMNLDLSKRRAASVVTWLIQHGIDSGRLSSEGYGITKPIDTNDTDAGRQANRRVEFKIIDEDAASPPPATVTPAP